MALDNQLDHSDQMQQFNTQLNSQLCGLGSSFGINSSANQNAYVQMSALAGLQNAYPRWPVYIEPEPKPTFWQRIVDFWKAFKTLEEVEYEALRSESNGS